MKETRLLIRADAGKDIGTGHVMRCLALAQAWMRRSAADVAFAYSEMPSSLAGRLENLDIKRYRIDFPRGTPSDSMETRRVANEFDAHWLVLDGYTFDSAYQKNVARPGQKTLILHDGDSPSILKADIVLNQNLFAAPMYYQGCAIGTKTLIGPRYALLREEFTSSHFKRQRQIADRALNIMVSFGGADSENYTQSVLDDLNSYSQHRLSVRVVLGSAYPHPKRIVATNRNFRHSIEFLSNVANISEIMAWADIGITAAGSTTLEAACMGLPCLVLHIAPNQLPVANELRRQGMAAVLDHYGLEDSQLFLDEFTKLVEDSERRRAYSQLGLKTVDGNGTGRIVKHMQAPDVNLRSVSWDDRALILRWANQPSTRRASFSESPISVAEHEKWLARQLENRSSFLWLGEVAGEPIGLVRYSLRGRFATISVNVDQAKRRMGLGPSLIAAGNTAIARNSSIDAIEAHVKVANQASFNAFRACGFVKIDMYERNGLSVAKLLRYAA